ncbi:MAG: protoglobin domain-containing protein [Isosphaeraceae bacterium]
MDQFVSISRFRELQAYAGWDPDDARRLGGCAALLAPAFPGIVDDFYDRIDRHPELRRVLTGEAAQRERLRRSLLLWLEDLTRGRYDDSYVARRWEVGLRHAELGLEPVYYTAAMSRIRGQLLDRLRHAWPGSSEELTATSRALNIILDLDLAIVGDAYQRASLARVQRFERLATLGQVARGVEHELRNPLNVIQTSVYYLRQAAGLSREKQEEHLRRIERHVEAADRVVSELYDFARMPAPQPRPFRVRAALAAVLARTSPPGNVELTTAGLDDLPRAFADESQIRNVFSNLIRNACDAMPEGGPLAISGEAREGFLEISFTDRGAGIPPERLDAIMEPFFTTKPRGLGLGLAISRLILEKCRGNLEVRSELGRGSTFVVRLPAADLPRPDSPQN